MFGGVRFNELLLLFPKKIQGNSNENHKQEVQNLKRQLELAIEEKDDLKVSF